MKQALEMCIPPPSSSNQVCLFSYMQSASTCTSILTFVNVDSGETTVISADVMSSPENITFDPAQLDTNSNYNVSVLAINVAGSAVSYTSISECCD